MNQRKDNIFLPGDSELSKILEKEARRPYLKDKENIHYPKFDLIISLLKSYDLSTEIFTDDSQDIYDVVREGKVLLNSLTEKVFNSKVNSNVLRIFDTIYDYLSEEDKPEKSDLIFVFGGKTILRAEKALELYQKELGNKILVSGGNPIYSERLEISEAETYKDYLFKNGVANENIFTEEESITVPDNVWRSLDLLEKKKSNFESLIIVNSPYTQRRGWSIFKKFLPDNVEIYRVNSDCKKEFLKENWHKQEDTFRVVINEFIKMRASVIYNTA